MCGTSQRRSEGMVFGLVITIKSTWRTEREKERYGTRNKVGKYSINLVFLSCYFTSTVLLIFWYLARYQVG